MTITEERPPVAAPAAAPPSTAAPIRPDATPRRDPARAQEPSERPVDTVEPTRTSSVAADAIPSIVGRKCIAACKLQLQDGTKNAPMTIFFEPVEQIFGLRVSPE